MNIQYNTRHIRMTLYCLDCRAVGRFGVRHRKVQVGKLVSALNMKNSWRDKSSQNI